MVFFFEKTQCDSPLPVPNFPLLSQDGKKECMLFFLFFLFFPPVVFVFNFIPAGKALFLHPHPSNFATCLPSVDSYPAVEPQAMKEMLSPLPAQMLVSWL